MTFIDHTIESAPPAARRSMEAVVKKLGYLPAGVARMSASPQLLDGFLRANGLFETTTLSPLAREVLVMTMATRNGCHICVALHSATLTSLGADPGLIAALRESRPLDDAPLEAMRRFVLEVLDTAGAVSAEAMEEFVGHGYTRRNALEVVLGIGVYTMSTLANRMTDAPLDAAMQPFA
ncbi:alkylhydroperoxidase AhpD family core domain-containing protein [Thermomonospora echinospora]|uniref:Alkylhydroperoxidase AhpD family core domain-containing protein n=1 Tax=Thermomonospora echinospora TaxID=1992 RepID=A0A1H6C6X8_9ACTN|nr:carboxymuconolactone decarboxylase family protein [Thermomonospora echinospora]SEG68672.1 alkylhydroperoxidase AhpD family core domain-containing protein [Thermomonospora echinospora]